MADTFSTDYLEGILKSPSPIHGGTMFSQNPATCISQRTHVRSSRSTFRRLPFGTEAIQLALYFPNQPSGAVVSHGTYVISRTLPIRMNRNGKVAQMIVPIGFLKR